MYFLLTLALLTWTIWRAPTNAGKWRMGFNSAFKMLNSSRKLISVFLFKFLKKKSQINSYFTYACTLNTTQMRLFISAECNT